MNRKQKAEMIKEKTNIEEKELMPENQPKVEQPEKQLNAEQQQEQPEQKQERGKGQKEKGDKNEIDMIHGPLLGKMIYFTIPILLSNMLQLVFNAADVIVVGRYAGEESLAAVGSTTALINLMVGLFMGLSIGANVVAAQFYGAGERERLSDTVHTSMMISVICGIFMMVVGVFASGTLLRWMNSPEEVIGLAELYLRIYFLAMPATLVYNFGASILRASGDTKTPLYFLFFAGVVNVVLNLVLVIRFSLDVAGVAIATVVSQYISAALILWYLWRNQGVLHFSFKKLKIHPDILKKIIRIGVPAGIQGMVFSLSNVVVQSSVNSFGKTVIAGNSAAANLEGFVYMAMNSVYQTAITFVGQNYGAGKNRRILQVMFRCLGIVFVIGLVMGNAAYLFSDSLLHIYSDSDAVVAAGIERVKYICIVYFICGMMDTMVGVMRGIGRSVLPMIVSLTGACLLRLVWIATIFQLHRTQPMLYIAYPITWTITLTAHIICFIFAFRKLVKKKQQPVYHDL